MPSWPSSRKIGTSASRTRWTRRCWRASRGTKTAAATRKRVAAKSVGLSAVDEEQQGVDAVALPGQANFSRRHAYLLDGAPAHRIFGADTPAFRHGEEAPPPFSLLAYMLC